MCMLLAVQMISCVAPQAMSDADALAMLEKLAREMAERVLA